MRVRGLHVDDGPCPNASCSSPGEVCSLDLSGEFSCQCASNCVSEETTEMQPHSNDNLWALFVIPFVVVIVLFVLLILVVLKRQKTRKVRENNVNCRTLFCLIILTLLFYRKNRIMQDNCIFSHRVYVNLVLGAFDWLIDWLIDSF